MAVPILVYHQIEKLPYRRIPFAGMFVDPDSFKRQMGWLARLGYRGVSVREAWPYITGLKHGKVVGITFDDGYSNTLHNAAPVLSEYGFSATNYIVANQIGGSNVWDRSRGIPPSACMNVSQLREWQAAGHEIGAHTLDHPLLTECSQKEAREQIDRCKTILEDLTGTEITSFCYPYGANNALLRNMVEEAGYDNAVTTRSTKAQRTDDRFGIPRIYIRHSHTVVEALLRILLK